MLRVHVCLGSLPGPWSVSSDGLHSLLPFTIPLQIPEAWGLGEIGSPLFQQGGGPSVWVFEVLALTGTVSCHRQFRGKVTCLCSFWSRPSTEVIRLTLGLQDECCRKRTVFPRHASNIELEFKVAKCFLFKKMCDVFISYVGQSILC